MSVPTECKYTKEHEWLKAIGSDCVQIGITDYAQRELGDVVFVELPTVGSVIAKGESLGTVESVKAVSDVYAPVSGTITAVNTQLTSAPESINQAPHGDGWLAELKPTHADELNTLLSAAEYDSLLTELSK